MIVVDASVGLKWLIEEEGSEAALALAAEHDLIAPSLFRAEVGNALLKKIMRDEIDQAGAVAALDILDRFVGEWVELADLTADAFALACELRHPVYGCYYLALAEQRDVGLASADRKFVARCNGLRFGRRMIDWQG